MIPPPSPAVRGQGVVLRGHPSACAELVKLLAYSYNKRDCAINCFVLLAVASSFAVATALGGLGKLGAFFWMPVTLLVSALQCIAAVLTQQQGFSLVWCCLAGLMLYEEAVWRAFSTLGAGPTGIAILAAVACVGSLIYYLAEEALWEQPSDLSGLHGARWVAVSCWDRVGTTLVHLVSISIGVALGAAADASPNRVSTFWALLGLGAVASAVALPVVLRHHRRLRSGCGVASVSPQNPTMSADELALASLESQLLKTRDRLSWLQAEEGRHASHAQRASSSSGGGSTSIWVGSSDCSGGSGGSSGRTGPEPESPTAADDEGAHDEEVESLRQREQLLLGRIADRSSPGLQRGSSGGGGRPSVGKSPLARGSPGCDPGLQA